jgi:hypothetical protein
VTYLHNDIVECKCVQIFSDPGHTDASQMRYDRPRQAFIMGMEEDEFSSEEENVCCFHTFCYRFQNGHRICLFITLKDGRFLFFSLVDLNMIFFNGSVLP